MRRLALLLTATVFFSGWPAYAGGAGAVPAEMESAAAVTEVRQDGAVQMSEMKEKNADGSGEKRAAEPGLPFAFADYYKDPNVISDAAFFGSWDAAAGEWLAAPRLNYSAYPELSNVEARAKEGDYAACKTLLRSYYKRKFSTFQRSNLSGSFNNYLEFMAYKHNILYTWSANKLAALLTAQPEWGWIEGDVSYLKSTDLSSPKAFYLVTLTKEDAVVEIKSKETGKEFEPRIEGMVNGQLRTFPADADTYISAGSNNRNVYGHEEKLLVAESPTSIGKWTEPANSNANVTEPVDENTYRTYLKFDLSGILPGDKLDSLTLKLYARNAGGEAARDILAVECYTTTWNEDNLIWTTGQIQHSLYSWYGDEGPAWRSNGFDNHFFRMEEDPIRFAKPSLPGNIAYFQNTGDKEGLYQAARMITHFIKTQPDPSWQKNLDASVRGQMFPEYLAYFVDYEDVVPDDVWVGILKYCFTLGEFLALPGPFDFDKQNNWGLYHVKGLLITAMYLEEFITAPDWLRQGYEWFEVLSETNILEDGTCVEGSLSYTSNTATDMVWPSTILEQLGRDPSELAFSERFDTKARRLARYLMDMSGPGFCDTQKGDGGVFTSGFTGKLKELGLKLGEPNLLWAGTSGREGTKPDYTSVFYPVGGKMAMRSDWSKDALYLFSNCDDTGHVSHGHYDDNNIILFAYGEYLLADPLYYTLGGLNGDPRHIWLVGTTGHNTVLVNDSHQVTAGDGLRRLGEYRGWETNNGFDFISQTTQTYTEAKHTREILFVKNKFWVVTDFLKHNNGPVGNTYEQLWHFRPNAGITIDPETKTIETHFSTANLKIVPVLTPDYAPFADYDEKASGIKKGYYSGGNMSITDADYASYKKTDITEDTAFNTILFPTDVMHDYDVTAENLTTNVAANKAAATRIRYMDKKTGVETVGIYYNLLDKEMLTERKADRYSTDGQMLYVERSGENETLKTAFLTNGKHIFDTAESTELIKSTARLENISVRWQGSSVYLDSMNTLPLEGLTVYGDEKTIRSVFVNDESVPFRQQGRYIYFGDKPVIEDDKEPEKDEGGGSQTSPSQSNNHGSSGGSIGGAVTPPVTSDEPVRTKTPFLDVAEDRWSYPYIQRLSESGAINGVTETLFEPTRPVTREEFVKMMVTAFPFPDTADGGLTFSDVPSEHWSAKYIKTAAELGVIRGIAPERFGLGERITREDLAVMIDRLAQYFGCRLEADGEPPVFADSDQISAYARSAVERLAKQGIVAGGENGEFLPKSPATREQAAKIICLMLELVK